MRFAHPAHPGRAVRLAYCLNLVPAEDVQGVLHGLRQVAAPLAQRLGEGARFGTGMWVPAAAAATFASGQGLDGLEQELVGANLDAFTFNAFPAGGFHERGLKERVFEPTWAEAARREFTLDVARLACHAGGDALPGEHVSISTHTGGFGDAADPDACADGMLAVATEFARLRGEGLPRIVLALEPEPRSAANDTSDLVRLRARLLERARDPALLAHIGTCLDTCHAAVEFESAESALQHATTGGAPLGKVQVTSALALRDPDGDATGRERLLALDEPVYLHQVTGRRADGTLVRATDLPEVAAAPERFEGCEEWRCHFHVPVQRTELDGLATTRAFADELVGLLLADPARWGIDELHLEIETYTWSVLPGPPVEGAALVDGIAAEYEHVLALLDASGWRRDDG